MAARLLVTHATSALCCCCRRGSVCRYDCLCFLVVTVMFFYNRQLLNNDKEKDSQCFPFENSIASQFKIDCAGTSRWATHDRFLV